MKDNHSKFSSKGGIMRKTRVTSCRTAVAVMALMALASIAAAQVCAPRRDLMYCGDSNSMGAQLYSGAGTYNEVSGCTPNASTQALLITRYGTVTGNGGAWLAYLNAGGTIVTEYSISAAVYNEIYGTAYSAGPFFGFCTDNTMPEVKLNPTNPFWVAHNIPVTPIGLIGCGFDLSNISSGEPQVTALGGAQSGAVSFVLRPQGMGHLYLLEADWQDGEPSYSNESRQFMGALIGTCPSTAAAARVPAPATNPATLLGMVAALTLLAARKLRPEFCTSPGIFRSLS
jgi:hypothetical protein